MRRVRRGDRKYRSAGRAVSVGDSDVLWQNSVPGCQRMEGNHGARDELVHNGAWPAGAVERHGRALRYQGKGDPLFYALLQGHTHRVWSLAASGNLGVTPQWRCVWCRSCLYFLRHWVRLPSCSIPDDHISPRRSALFMARSVLREFRDGAPPC